MGDAIMPEINHCSVCNEEISASDQVMRGVGNNKHYHRSCVESRGLIKCSIRNCEIYMTSEEISPITAKGFLCPEHFKTFYFTCQCCGEIFPKSQEYKINTENNKPICASCFEQKFFKCMECGKIHPIEERKEICFASAEISVCQRCFTKFQKCSHCGQLVKTEDMVNIFGKDRETIFSGCETCAKKENFIRCSSCGDWLSKDYANQSAAPYAPGRINYSCEPCYYKHNIINNYSYKPKFVNHRIGNEKSKLLLGMENEIEYDRNLIGKNLVNNYEITLKNSDPYYVNYETFISYIIDKAIPNFLYLKHDGSLDWGVEIVSHPATIEFWREQKDNLKTLFDLLSEHNCSGEKAKTAGMHVHIARAKMNLAHKNSFCAFIHGNSEFVKKIARRGSNRYSKYIDINDEERKAPESVERKFFHHDRYEAVNWNSKSTVEVRVFQSTLNINHFLANLEFCQAAYDFTAVNSVAEVLSDSCIDNFKKFVEENRFIYLPETIAEVSDQPNV